MVAGEVLVTVEAQVVEAVVTVEKVAAAMAVVEPAIQPDRHSW